MKTLLLDFSENENEISNLGLKSWGTLLMLL
jgi:hypothetical protein